jgi:hypothetical protein
MKSVIVPEDRKPIYCDCCGKEVMAWQYQDGRIVVTDRRHGQRHTVSIRPKPVVHLRQVMSGEDFKRGVEDIKRNSKYLEGAIHIPILDG